MSLPIDIRHAEGLFDRIHDHCYTIPLHTYHIQAYRSNKLVPYRSRFVHALIMLRRTRNVESSQGYGLTLR
jgi:hypothetical protein